MFFILQVECAWIFSLKVRHQNPLDWFSHLFLWKCYIKWHTALCLAQSLLPPVQILCKLLYGFWRLRRINKEGLGDGQCALTPFKTGLNHSSKVTGCIHAPIPCSLPVCWKPRWYPEGPRCALYYTAQDRVCSLPSSPPPLDTWASTHPAMQDLTGANTMA